MGTKRKSDLVIKLPLSAEEKSRWNLLVSMAEASLDERGVEDMNARKAKAKKVLAKMGMDSPPADVDAVKRALLEYMRVVDSDDGGGITMALKSVGASRGDFLTAMHLDPDVKTVEQHLRMRREELIRITSEDALAAAQKAQMRLLTEEGCELSAKMAMFTLENLDVKTYGGAEATRGMRESTAQTVYQISGVTINMAPQLKAVPPPEAVPIDVVVREAADGEHT